LNCKFYFAIEKMIGCWFLCGS